MRILVLSKRQYMRRDLIDDRYGRFFELSAGLSDRGHDVVVSCLSYRAREPIWFESAAQTERGIRWTSHNLIDPLAIVGRDGYCRDMRLVMREWRPELILAFGDAYQVLIAQRVAETYRLPVVADLYDNFESYPATRVPGIRSAFRKSLTRANGICCVSEALSKHLHAVLDKVPAMLVLENAVDSAMIYPRDRKAARAHFGVDSRIFVVGAVGALDDSRDIETVYQAFDQFRRKQPDALLVLAGVAGKHREPPRRAGIRYFGDLKGQQELATFYGMLDVGLVSVKPGAFGDYCDPQKAVEMLACDIPVISSNVGVLARRLGPYPDSLYEAGNPQDLAEVLYRRSQVNHKPQFRPPDWSTQARRLDSFLASINTVV